MRSSCKAYVYGRDLENFINWMKKQGVEIIRTNRIGESFRIRTARGVSIAYRKADFTYIFTRELEFAWHSFRFGTEYRFSINRTGRKKMKVPVIVYELLKRDGDRCFYCEKKLKIQDIAVEHICPISCGGPNHLSNMALACKRCDGEMSNKPIVEKIRIRDQKRFEMDTLDDDKLYNESTEPVGESESFPPLRLQAGGCRVPPAPFSFISEVNRGKI